MGSIVFQAGIAFAIVFAAAIYAAVRRESGSLRWIIVALHLEVMCWIAGAALLETGATAAARQRGLSCMLLSAMALPPTFFMWVSVYARLAVLSRRPAMVASTFAPFVFFCVAYLTNDTHHWMMRSGSDAIAAHPDAWAGPLYWAFQVCAYLAIFAGLALSLWVTFYSPSPIDRRRAWLALAALVPPLLAHAAYTWHWLPLEVPLTPAALAASALLLAAGIRRYRMLGPEPLVRLDVFEELPDGVVLADAEGRIVDANAAAARLLGVSRGELRERTIGEALGLLSATGPGKVLARRIERLPLTRGRVSAEIATEDERMIEVNAGGVAASGSQPAGRYVLLRDRTAQHRFERLVRARQKHESIGILAAGVAHEINNPLAFARANLQHLERLGGLVGAHLDAFEKSEAADLREIGEVVQESVAGLDRISKIVEGLVSFSRIPVGDETEVDVNEAVDAAIRFSALHEIRTLDVGVRLEKGLPRVRASADRIVQMLLNLFLNAKQALAGRSDGLVLVETRHQGDAVEVRVQDNGPGIPEMDLERIFDPFFTTRDSDSIAGLGLSSAFDIVSDIGGTIEVSAKPGSGACFTVRLPVDGKNGNDGNGGGADGS